MLSDLGKVGTWQTEFLIWRNWLNHPIPVMFSGLVCIDRTSELHFLLPHVLFLCIKVLVPTTLMAVVLSEDSIVRSLPGWDSPIPTGTLGDFEGLISVFFNIFVWLTDWPQHFVCGSWSFVSPNHYSFYYWGFSPPLFLTQVTVLKSGEEARSVRCQW